MGGFDELKAVGKELFIETYVELFGNEIVDTLGKILAPLNPDNLKQLVAEGKAPPVPDEAVEELKGYEDYLEKLKPEEVFEWLFKARPDLANTLVSLGDEGAEYMVKWRAFIMDSIRNPEGAPTKPAAESLVELHCESCGAKWPLPKELAEQVTMCPFCGKGKEEETGEVP